MRFPALLALAALLPAADLTLLAEAPATRPIEEGYPIGNGRLGALILGGTTTDRIAFNEGTLWIGDEEDTGAYQAFGDVLVEFPAGGAVTGYARTLDLERAVVGVQGTQNGAVFTRTAFASHPDQVIVVRYEDRRPGGITARIRLTDTHRATISAQGNRLTAAGSLAGYRYTQGSAKGKPPRDYTLALSYEAQVLALPEGGTVTTTPDALEVRGASALTLVLGAGTDYLQDRTKGWRGEAPHARVTAQVDAAAAKGFAALLAAHEADYRPRFGTVDLDLGTTPGAAAKPTVTRLKDRAAGQADPGLEALLFQYGRYLLLSSSRASGVPANLQGIWNISNEPPWRCDYHSDVNLQMNYWPADVANIPDAFQPFSDWLWSVRDVRRAATAAHFKTRGWTFRGENGLFGGATWNWLNAGSAWFCQNLWDHYAFTQDRAYLAERAYPMMKEVSEFWIDLLKPGPDGRLVAPKNFSPEQMSYEEEGVTFDQMLVWDLFTNTIAASEALGTDAAFRAQLTDLRSRLLMPKIGKWGQLQEWMTDRDDPKNTHRHLSHLIGLHPGRQISPRLTPELAQAARVSLLARGDISTGWSTAVKINLWARLLDGERAYALVGRLLNPVTETGTNYSKGGGVYANLFDAHPPFQIDGNFGYTAGICEMLVQSHLDEVHLLPALPKAWPTGHVRGLRVRGGALLDLAWKDGAVASYRLTAPTPRPMTVRIGTTTTTVTAGPE